MRAHKEYRIQYETPDDGRFWGFMHYEEHVLAWYEYKARIKRRLRYVE